jgi:aspartate carbamoyltransferase regulatory subunit
MSNEHSMRRVTAIRNGTVIDHIPCGQSLTVLEMLGVTGSTSVPVSLVMNVPSKKMGSKDIIKVEDRELTQGELDRLALVAPDAHVAIIRAYSVAEKLTINLGEEVVNVVNVQCLIVSRPILENHCLTD